MVDTAILTGARAQTVTPARSAQRDGSGEGAQGEGGFASLLNVVEQIAALGGLVLPQGQAPVPPRQAMAAEANAAPVQKGGLGAELTALIHQRVGQVVSAGNGAAAEGEGTKLPVPPRAAPLSPSGLRPEKGDARLPGQLPEPKLGDGQPVPPRAQDRSDFLMSRFATRNAFQSGTETAALQRGVQAADLLPQKSSAGDGQPPVRLETQVAASPRLDAAIQQHASPETSNPVVRQVATNLQFVARGQMERLRVDLHPEELGRVQIELQKSGTVTRLTIVTETAQAFEALQRGASGLQQSLSQAGFDTEDMRFEHKDGRGEDHQDTADERRERSERDRNRREDEARREVLIRPAGPADRRVFL
jgi:hypothetical protein